MKKSFFPYVSSSIAIIMFIVIAGSSLIVLPSSAQLSIGSPADQQNVIVTISNDGQVEVIHEIKRTSTPRSLEAIRGVVSNVTVTDMEGNEKQFGTSAFEETTHLTIFPTSENVLVKYKLKPEINLIDNVWTWDFLYRQSTVFNFPDQVDLIFINENPILLTGGERKIKCHGCQMKLEYTLNEPEKFIDIEYEGEKFIVEMRTFSNVSKIIFNQPLKKISFNAEGEKFVTLTIPLKLLWNPYNVFLNEERILDHEFAQNETHVMLSFKPKETGMIEIIGTSVIPEFLITLVPLAVGIIMIISLQLFKSRMIILR